MKQGILIAGVAAACVLIAFILRGRADRSVAADEPARPPAVDVIDEVGGNGGFTYAVDVEGPLAVFGRGREVVVADVSDPSSPREIRAVTLPGDVRDVVLENGLVFAAADTGGLQIIDPETAEMIGSLEFGDRAYGVDAVGDRVFVAARSRGLRVVDASDPSSPREIGHYVTPDEAVGVVLRDDMAYVAAWYESMRIVDVSDAASPAEIGFAPYDSYDHGAVWSVAVDGNVGLVLIPEKGFKAVDVSDPANVTIHSRYTAVRAPSGAALIGRTAFVADQDAGLRVFDFSDLSEPVEIGALDLPGRVMDVVVSEDVAYVAAREGGLRLVDVSEPHLPREIGFLDSGDALVDVVSPGGLLLAVGAQNGVYRYEGRLIRMLDAPARRVAVDGSRIVTAGKAGLRVYEEGELLANVPGEAHGVAVRADLIATAGPLGVHFFGMAPNGTLREIGGYAPNSTGDVGRLHRTPPAAWDVLLADERAFAAFDDGIHVIDFSGVLVGRIDTPERVYRLAFSGETLAAACDDGLRLIDLSDTSRPDQTLYVKTPSFATGLLIDGDTMYVGDLNGNVTAVSASEGRLVGRWRVADRVLGLARAESGIAVAAGSGGMRIVSLRTESSQ